GTVFSATMAALTPNTSYYFRVSAENAIGHPSYAGTLGPVATDPVAPDGGAFQKVGTTQLQISWVESLPVPNNPTSITRHLVHAPTSSDFSSPTSTVTALGASIQIVQGLFANTTYWVRVAARGHNGTDSPFLVIGTTVTRPVTPANAGFPMVGISSITV